MKTVVNKNLVFVDSRDFSGHQAAEIARKNFTDRGKRGPDSGTIESSLGLYPTTVVSANNLREGDIVFITSSCGKTVERLVAQNVTPASFEVLTFNNFSLGTWSRPADPGYPTIDNNPNIIHGANMTAQIKGRVLIDVTSVSLVHISVPRDIIPFEEYIDDLLVGLRTNVPVSFVPQDPACITSELRGLFGTKLSVFRSYSGQFEMPDQATPFPLRLWNPPVGPWPLQPLPYPGQTVPTYVSNYVNIGGDPCVLVCSGLGVYDLKDFTGFSRSDTDSLRRALLTRITRYQTSHGHDSSEIINAVPVTSKDTWPYGYGAFQRFVPGPGLGLNYQPGLSDSANPRVPSGDYPVAFPDFMGNVWGEYDVPGARFQAVGLRTVIQDLFLNGDLDNIHGAQVVTSDLRMDSELVQATLANFSCSTSPNILNAQRIVFNGFGAVYVTSNGLGFAPSVSQYQNAGGSGPGLYGPWVASGVYGPATSDDPLATGPGSSGTLLDTDAPAGPLKKIAYYDTGANRGSLLVNVSRFKDFLVNSVQEKNLVVHCMQIPRSLNSMQTTDTDGFINSSILNIPIKIRESSIGNYEDLMSGKHEFEYWKQRYPTPLASLDCLNLRFSTDSGAPIIIEKVLGLSRKYTGTSPRARLSDRINFVFDIRHIVKEIDHENFVADEGTFDFEFDQE